MIQQPSRYTTCTIEELAETRKALDKLLRDRMRRKAVVIDKHGNAVMTVVYPTPEKLDEDIKPAEVVVTDCDPEDEKDWMEILEDIWNIAPLDMAAGKEKYPELYI